jgi:hypothetical protein
MKTIGKSLFRVVSVFAMLMLVFTAITPAAVSAAAPTGDDFNRCDLTGSVWNTVYAPDDATAEIIGGYQGGESVLKITLPAGQQGTISGANKNAPRVMQPITDESFEFEVKFNSALAATTATGQYRMQGILVRDEVNDKWLRFDLNADNDTFNFYAGYTAGNTTQHFTGSGGGVSVINMSDLGQAPVRIRVKYDKDAKTWSMRYNAPNRGWSNYFNINMDTPPAGSAFTFVPSAIGVFAGSTGTTPPGMTVDVDYFLPVVGGSVNVTAEDAITLTVNTATNGTVNRTCSGNQVTLDAVPNTGYKFDAWTGAGILTPNADPLILTMDKSYTVTPVFVVDGGGPVEDDFLYYLPFVSKP